MLKSEDLPSDSPAQRRERPRRVLDLKRDERRRVVFLATIRTLLIAVSLLFVYYSLDFDWSSVAEVAALVAAVLVLIGGAGVWQLRSIARSDLPEVRAFEALASSTIVLVVLFASVYVSLSLNDPEAFSEPLNHTGALYFTLTTLTTVGFGDITARTDGARVAVMVQMVTNVVVLGVVIKLIIAVARRRMADADD